MIFACFALSLVFFCPVSVSASISGYACDILDVGNKVYEDPASLRFKEHHELELASRGVQGECLRAWRQIPTSNDVLDELISRSGNEEGWLARWEDKADLALESYTRRAIHFYLLLKQLQLRGLFPSDCAEVMMGHLSYACDCAEWLRQVVEKYGGSFPELFTSREARDAFNRFEKKKK
jgi:hypothetical protein